MTYNIAGCKDLDDLYSTTKETHQSLLGTIMEIWIKKWKYNYIIFRSNQFCIISVNCVTVLLKSVHAICLCLDKGSISKMTSFSLENQFTRVNFVQKPTWPSPAAITASIRMSNQKHVTPHKALGNLRPFLMESNLKLSKIPSLHWTIPDASPELIHQLDLGLLILRCLFWLLHTLDYLVREGHTAYWTKWTD